VSDEFAAKTFTSVRDSPRTKVTNLEEAYVTDLH